MNRIDERLKALGVDVANMTDEQKFTVATGLTHYDEATANNSWYVPGGAANIVSEISEEENEEPQTQYYTAETAAAYNATLEGAVKAGDLKETESDNYDYIYDEASWNTSYASGGLKKYYVWSDAANAPYKEDLWNTVENRAANINDARKEGDEYVIDDNGNYVYDNCKRSWQGAVNAPGAKYPWIVPYFDTDVNAKIKFQYENTEVMPWGDNIFGIGKKQDGSDRLFGCASIPVELGEEFLLTNGETTFNINKFKMFLVTVYTEEEANEYNAKLTGAVKAGDNVVSTIAIETQG